MSEALKTGLELLVLGVIFSGFFALNLKTGKAFLRTFIGAERHSNPFGFWLVQGIIGVFALTFLVSATLVVFGLAPS